MQERAAASRVPVRGSPGAAAALLVAAAMVDPALAVEAQPFEPEKKPAIRLKLDGSEATTLDLKRFTTFYADHVRARDRNPELMPPGNAARVSERGFSPGGVNVDDGNLNYAKGSSVSRSANALADVELNHRPLAVRAFLRAKAWDDIAQRKDEVPHGNHPNGYAALRPLSDRGFSEHGEFNNATIMDAYVERTWAGIAGQPLLVRLGQQMIPWGQQETTILGGLEQINAIDYPARFRAASLLDGTLARDTGYVPAPAIFTRWGDRRSRTVVEAFYFFKFQPNELGGCGTFFALADYVTDGCDRVLAQPNTVTDPAAIAAGIYADRAPDRDAKDGGQFGFALKQTTDFGQFGAYFSNYHSRRFSPSAIRSTRAAALPLLIPGNPGNENVRYFIEYPENVRVFGLTYAAADIKAGRWGLYGEYTYRPNQSVLLNSVDLFNAFTSTRASACFKACVSASSARLGSAIPDG